MRRSLIWLLLCGLLLTLSPFVHAQDETTPSPLLAMLALAPDTPAIRESIVSYQDFRAVEDARDWLERPESAAAFWESDPNLTFTFRWHSAPRQVSDNFRRLTDIPAVMGFDFFDINRTLTFGLPPQDGIVWAGDFDPAAIEEAHAGRGYVPASIEGIEAWSAPEGDSAPTPADRNIANLFDSGLGRQIPFLLTAETPLSDSVIVSGSMDLLIASATALNGEMSSLADAPDYRAAAEAVTDYPGLLIGVQFWPLVQAGGVVANSPIPLMFGNPEEFQEQIESGAFETDTRPEWGSDYGELPVYLLAAFADRQEGDRQVAVIALVYPDAASAEIAGAEVARRLPTYAGAFRAAPEPVITQVEEAEISHRVYESSTGLAVALIEVSYATPTQEEETAPFTLGSGPTQPALFFTRLIQALQIRDFAPLWFVIAEAE